MLEEMHRKARARSPPPNPSREPTTDGGPSAGAHNRGGSGTPGAGAHNPGSRGRGSPHDTMAQRRPQPARPVPRERAVQNTPLPDPRARALTHAR
eukprot:2428633-Prymnesium_polylepis.1